MVDDESTDVVLVEDNPTDAELTMLALQQTGLAKNVVCLEDGEEALNFVFCTGMYARRSPEPPKLILLDLKLPKVDGIEVLRKIKGDRRTKWIPVVILTSSPTPRDIFQSYHLGANGYLVKPMDFDRFNEAISSAAHFWLVLNERPRTNPYSI